jgi:malate synthase
VAHPDLVPIATAVFDETLAERPNQLTRLRGDVSVSAADLLSVPATPGEVTDAGLRTNVNVGILYLESWLRGIGAAAIYNLMEDAATAEISRSQVWQWVRHGRFSKEDVRRVVDEELQRIRELVGTEAYDGGRFAEARQLFEQISIADDFVDFLTLPAYDLLD